MRALLLVCYGAVLVFTWAVWLPAVAVVPVLLLPVAAPAVVLVAMMADAHGAATAAARRRLVPGPRGALDDGDGVLHVLHHVEHAHRVRHEHLLTVHHEHHLIGSRPWAPGRGDRLALPAHGVVDGEVIDDGQGT